MLDHVFAQLVSSIRHAFEEALLERQAVEERFQVDVFLGDVSFETSYSLPGEERPARIRVDVGLDWPTWSQTSYRSRLIGEEPDEPPEVLVEIAFRLQAIDGSPEIAPLLAVVPARIDFVGDEPLTRGETTVEQLVPADPASSSTWAVEVSYEGPCRLDEDVLDRPGSLDELLMPLGRQVASLLVRMGDLPYSFLSGDDPQH